MPTNDSIEIRLPNRVIDHADERAAFFFVSNISSVGASAYDRRVVSPENPADHFQVADVRALNSTMMARTQYAHWAEFTESAVPPAWLQALDASWDPLPDGRPGLEGGSMRKADPGRVDGCYGPVPDYFYHHQAAPPEAPQADTDL